MTDTKQTADSISIRKCNYTGAMSIRPLKKGNITLHQVGVSIYKKTQLAKAFEMIRKEINLPEIFETEIRSNIEFQRLPM